MKNTDSYEFNCSYSVYHSIPVSERLQEYWFDQQVKFAKMTAGNAMHLYSEDMYPDYCSIRQQCIWLYKKKFTMKTIINNMIRYFIK